MAVILICSISRIRFENKKCQNIFLNIGNSFEFQGASCQYVNSKAEDTFIYGDR